MQSIIKPDVLIDRTIVTRDDNLFTFYLHFGGTGKFNKRISCVSYRAYYFHVLKNVKTYPCISRLILIVTIYNRAVIF